MHTHTHQPTRLRLQNDTTQMSRTVQDNEKAELLRVLSERKKTSPDDVHLIDKIIDNFSDGVEEVD